jgi:hypothetical protein
MGLSSRIVTAGAEVALLFTLAQPVEAATPPSKFETTEVAATKMRVTQAVGTTGLALRDAAKTSASTPSTVVTRIPAGTEVSVLKVDGDWAQVEVNVGGRVYRGWAALRISGVTYLENPESAADRAAGFAQSGP